MESGVRGRMSVIYDHSDAVWSLFNNDGASEEFSRWLFSASASGCVKGHDMESGEGRDDV